LIIRPGGRYHRQIKIGPWQLCNTIQKRSATEDAASEFNDNLIFLAASSVAERFWMVLHSCQGPILICLWYRPPGRIINSDAFEHEYRIYIAGCINSPNS
jgi:hypothetical protein